MKKFNDEVIKEATTKEDGKIKNGIKKAVNYGKQFCKDHWKGIISTGAVFSLGAIATKHLRKDEDEPMDFEQDTIENAEVDFGETFTGSTEEAVDTEE